MEVGIDCVNVLRFSRHIMSKKRIIYKIFTEKEIQYCEKKERPEHHYAVRFAGKEAVIKAFSGYNITIQLNKIEILNHKRGIPYVNILDDKIMDYEIKISLSHSKEIAVALVVIDKILK